MIKRAFKFNNNELFAIISKLKFSSSYKRFHIDSTFCHYLFNLYQLKKFTLRQLQNLKRNFRNFMKHYFLIKKSLTQNFTSHLSLRRIEVISENRTKLQSVYNWIK